VEEKPMTNERRRFWLEKARNRTVDWCSESLWLDRLGKGEQADRARRMADRWQQLQKKIGRML
jgi:hypothetical protein